MSTLTADRKRYFGVSSVRGWAVKQFMELQSHREEAMLLHGHHIKVIPFFPLPSLTRGLSMVVKHL